MFKKPRKVQKFPETNKEPIWCIIPMSKLPLRDIMISLCDWKILDLMKFVILRWTGWSCAWIIKILFHAISKAVKVVRCPIKNEELPWSSGRKRSHSGSPGDTWTIPPGRMLPGKCRLTSQQTYWPCCRNKLDKHL